MAKNLNLALEMSFLAFMVTGLDVWILSRKMGWTGALYHPQVIAIIVMFVSATKDFFSVPRNLNKTGSLKSRLIFQLFYVFVFPGFWLAAYYIANFACVKQNESDAFCVDSRPISHSVVWLALAISIILSGGWLRAKCFETLKENFGFDADRPPQQVVRNGPYRFVRHPSYIGVALWAFPGHVMYAWPGLIYFTLVVGGFLLWYSNREERCILERGNPELAAAYKTYQQETPRLLPSPSSIYGLAHGFFNSTEKLPHQA